MFEIHQLWSRLWCPNVIGEIGHGVIAPLGTDVGQVWVLVTSWAPRGHWIGCREVGKSGVFGIFLKDLVTLVWFNLASGLFSIWPILATKALCRWRWRLWFLNLLGIVQITSRIWLVRKPEVFVQGCWAFWFRCLGAKVVSFYLASLLTFGISAPW